MDNRSVSTMTSSNLNRPLNRFVLGLTFSALTLILQPAMAQEEAAEGEAPAAAGQQQTTPAPTMSEAVYARLQAVEACLSPEDEEEEPDYECAIAELDRLQAMRSLTSYEKVQMYNTMGYVYFGQNDYENALDAYLKGLEEPEIPISSRLDFMSTSTQLLNALERYDEALEMMLMWFDLAESTPGQEPGANNYYLLAVLYYQLDRYQDAIEPIETAIRMRAADGDPPEETWYQINYVLYFELEDLENTSRVLKITAQNWPKKNYFLQLAGIYAEQDKNVEALALFHTAYEAGWLSSNGEYVTTASYLMNNNVPFLAASVLQDGLDEDIVNPTLSNWRMLAQAWQMAQEDELALPALANAAAESEEGDIYLRLANSYMNLYRFPECVENAENSLERGGLDRPDEANLLLGTCRVETGDWTGARQALRNAAGDERSQEKARQWLEYVDSEEERQSILADARERN